MPRTADVVRSFMLEKGFGFIHGDDGRDYFVHVNEVSGGELVDGQRTPYITDPALIARSAQWEQELRLRADKLNAGELLIVAPGIIEPPGSLELGVRLAIGGWD